MTLSNNTPMEAYYGVSYGNAFECGTIPAQQTVENPAWDNQPALKVVFSAIETGSSSSGNPFSIMVPQSGTMMCVTIGMYQE